MRRSSLLTRKGLYTPSSLILVIVILFSSFSGVAFAVTANPVKVSLSGSVNTVTYGQSITFDSNVTDSTAGNNTIPTGTVTFYDNGSVIHGAQSLVPQNPEIIWVKSPPGIIPDDYKQACMVSGSDTNSAQDCPVLKWGEYTFWGYSDTNNMGDFNIVQYDGEGNVVTQYIDKTLGLRYLYKITLDNGAGTVTFSGQGDISRTLSYSDLNAATSNASITTILSVGHHTIQAKFAGDSRHDRNESTYFMVDVPKLTSSLTMTSSVASSVYGEKVSFTAAIPSISGLVPSGDVIFYDGNAELGTVTLEYSNSVSSAVYESASLASGTHTITARYSGDLNFSASEKSVLQNVDKIGSIISMDVLPSAVLGDSIGADVHVRTLGNVIPAGTIDLIIDDQTVGSSGLDENGSVHMILPQLSVGLHKLQAAYRGTVNIKNSVSQIEQLTVLNTNADLSGIALSSSTLTPVFAAGTTSYSAEVTNQVSSITVTPGVYDSNATMTVNGAPVTNGQASDAINLVVGSNTITIVVTAQSGTTKTYTVTVTRAQASSGNDGGSTSPSSGGTVTSTDGTLTLPVGKSGEVSLGNAVKISIPANAAGKELKLTIEQVTDTLKLITKNEVLASPIFEVLKNFSENFSKDITMTFAFDPTSLKAGQVPNVFYYDESKQVWVKVGGEVNGNTITAKVNHFTKFAVLGVDSDSTTNPKQPITFSDITGHWAEANIKQAVRAGIVNGYQDGTFKPEHTITRAEFAVMMMNALKPQGDGAELTFTDKAKIGSWAQKSVSQAVYGGIITGYEDRTFRPDAEITRAEMAAMIAKSLAQPIEEKTATGFADDKYIPDWARGAVATMKKLGIIEGKGKNQFAPSDKTTRAEAVTVLLKMLALKSK